MHVFDKTHCHFFVSFVIQNFMNFCTFSHADKVHCVTRNEEKRNTLSARAYEIFLEEKACVGGQSENCANLKLR